MENSEITGLDSIKTRLIIIWALVEISLGGFLHALRIPLTGLLVGSMAILSLYLIARQSSSYREVVQACILVMGLKFAFSPQSSPFSYVAMLVQTLCMLPLTGPYRRPGKMLISSLIVIASLYSPLQKILILWFTLGNDTIVAIKDWIHMMLPFNTLHSMVWWLLLILWFSMHLLAGLFISTFAYRWRLGVTHDVGLVQKWKDYRDKASIDTPTRNKAIAKRLVFFILFLLLVPIMIFSIVSKSSWSFLLLRPIAILGAWFLILRPLMLMWASKRNRIKSDSLIYQRVHILTPVFRRGVQFSWVEAKQVPWIQFPGRFMTVFFTWAMCLSWEN